MASASKSDLEKPGQPSLPKESKTSRKKGSLLQSSITDQWNDFPQFGLPKNVQTPNSEDPEECRCLGPVHHKKCDFEWNNPGKPVAPAQYWKTVDDTFKARGPKPKVQEKVVNRYSLEAVRARAVANGEISDEEDFCDDYSDYMADFGVTPNSDTSHIDPFMVAMFRDMWRQDGRLPKTQTKCSICSEGHHHKRCPYYEAYGKRTKNRYQTAVDYYQNAQSEESRRNASAPQPPQ